MKSGVASDSRDRAWSIVAKGSVLLLLVIALAMWLAFCASLTFGAMSFVHR